MKKLTHSLPAKIAALLLLVFFVVGCLCAGSGIAYMEGCGYYESESFLDSRQAANITENYVAQVFEYLELCYGQQENAEYLRDYLEKRLMQGETNYCFYVADESGNILLKNFEGEPGQTVDYGEYIMPDGTVYHQYGFVREITAQDDYYQSYLLYSQLAPKKHSMIVWLGIFAAGALGMVIFLFCAVGHKAGHEEIVQNWQDRIPLDLFAALILTLGLMLAFLTERVLYQMDLGRISGFFLGAVPFCLAWLLLALDACLSMATRLKAGKWWQSAVVYRVGRWLVLRLREVFSNFKLTWKIALTFLAYLFANGFLLLIAAAEGNEFFVILALALNFFVLIWLCRGGIQLQEIFRGGERIADGALDYKINAEGMNRALRGHAETLNNIGGGLSRAVEERMQSERMKTELITNVSHDIKTPLTSIVNYVDLLGKEQIPGERAQEYLAVLERQSQRLKKLIEDLVEASKASTGNLQVDLQLTDVAELCRQTAGEYTDRLGARELELIAQLPDEAYIYADGRYLFRVLDNLLGNICKYAQKGTRVYLDLAFAGQNVAISLKNISRDRLNISPGELMERFVRGDSARSTEGSGLGLSIARSLTELQGGTFDIEIDGDLFKVQICFPAAPLI